MGGENATDAEPYKLVLSGDGVQIDKPLDRETAMRVIALVVGGEVPGASSPATRSKTKRSRRRGKGANRSKSTVRRRAGSPGLVKDLGLRPKGKKAFVDFANEKEPKTHQQKQAVIVYWLRHEAGLGDGITADHVNTCYQAAGWKRPNDLDNALSVTSGKKGWLDTSDRSNIRLTVTGEDLVTHELPPQEK